MDLLRLRRRLIPYIYTMNYKTYKYGSALIEPMYYAYPDDENAYHCKNQYYFGSELICAPVTDPADKKTGLAAVNVWLPEGRYTDLFTRRSYAGGNFVKMFRGIENFPVLAKAGAILPLDTDDISNGAENPSGLEILALSGNGSFTMYEDDGETMGFENGAFAETKFEIETNGDHIVFTIFPVSGDFSAIPSKRYFKVNFFDIVSAESVAVTYGKEVQNTDDLIHYANGSLCVDVFCDLSAANVPVKIEVCGAARYSLNKREAYIETVSKYQISNDYKKSVFTSALESGALPKCQKQFREPLEELEHCL